MTNSIQLNEKEVQKVLARAVELERELGAVLTEAQVREIAREVSIPSAAIDQALAEYRNGAEPRIAARKSSRPWRSRVIVAMTVGIALVVLALVALTTRIPSQLP